MEWQGVYTLRTSLVAQTVNNPPAMQETWVRSLRQEDPREGNGSPLQCSCLENSTDRGAWQATVFRVAKSLIQLSTHALIDQYVHILEYIHYITYIFHFLLKQITHG